MSLGAHLSPFTAADGENIAIHDWLLPEHWPQQAIRGTVIIVHGLGDHAFRYHHVALRLNADGYNVRAYDQYGHGESGGIRGGLPSEMRLVDDLADVIDDTRRLMRQGQKLILLGHSMGGLVVASFVRQHMRPVDGLILSSPAFDPGLSWIQKVCLSILPRIAPRFRVNNGLKVEMLSRDPTVVQAYRNDPFVHSKINSQLARFISQEGARCIAAAHQWFTPTLLLYAGSDALVNPAGSRAFATAAPPHRVQSRCFESMYHEIFNDPDSKQVFDSMRAWLAQLTN
jgi:alpha-beta hydrolase superfamily lysophospholipase